MIPKKVLGIIILTIVSIPFILLPFVNGLRDGLIVWGGIIVVGSLIFLGMWLTYSD